MSLENIMLSDRSQSQKYKYCTTCYPKAMICLPRVQPQGPGVPGCPRDNDSVAYQPLPGPA